MPSPPQKPDSQDVKGHIKKSVGEAHCKWLTPARQLQPVDSNVGGVVKAGICEGKVERYTGSGFTHSKIY